MEKINFRRANFDDYDVVNALLENLFEYHKGLVPGIFSDAIFQNYSIEDFSCETADDDKAWFVAEINGEIVGAVLAYITANRYDEVYCYIDGLYVKADYRGRGVATGLMHKVEEFAKSNCVDSIQVDLWAGNETGAKFYQSLGLQPIKFTLEKKFRGKNE